ncbi:ribbon-helix-helix protein, CopG family [Neorhizobium sp. T25_27]|uniref:ribbon-helix-helix protein, CopG family n=1 Tax=Neorhizobium sp. T25_27 TaxID=2093831 RepID=UPI00155E84DE|nr:ribbon-helix-helix protein, CopG family [Neorhizobium sp. T25_27]
MAVQNRISVSFSDEEYVVLERLSAHTHKSKAELIRTIVSEYLREHPNRFRRNTSVGIDRAENLLLSDPTALPKKR